MIRSYASGFIFTTSLPPVNVAGARASISYQREYMGDRQLKQINVRDLKSRFENLDIPVVPGPSHIVPVLVGDPALARLASDTLLAKHNVYVQAINYPTVARGEERLRFTVTPGHTAEQIARLSHAVDETFTELGIKRTSQWKEEGGRAGVGLAGAKPVHPIWTDEQVGLLDGTAPRVLHSGDAKFVDPRAVQVTREKFNDLLGPYVQPPAFKRFGALAVNIDMPVSPQPKVDYAPAPISVVYSCDTGLSSGSGSVRVTLIVLMIWIFGRKEMRFG